MARDQGPRHPSSTAGPSGSPGASDRRPPAPFPPEESGESALVPVPEPPRPKPAPDSAALRNLRENLQPAWRQQGLKLCTVCGWAVAKDTGICSNGGTAHPVIGKYTPTMGNCRTVTFDNRRPPDPVEE